MSVLGSRSLSGARIASPLKPLVPGKRSQFVSTLKELNSLFESSSRHGAIKPRKILLRFTASWCQPCQRIKPKFDSISVDSKYADTSFVTVDIDKGFDIAAKYNIKSVPTFVLLNGEHRELQRVTGGDMQAVEAALRQR